MEQEKAVAELQDLYENLMRDAGDIGLEKDQPRSSQRGRFAFSTKHSLRTRVYGQNDAKKFRH